MLDTNICVFLLRGKYGIDRKIDIVGLENCYISEITEAAVAGRKRQDYKDDADNPIFIEMPKIFVV